ncbi:protein phosphatase 1 regulatory subunit 36-like [Stomoxys calcitrans]|uniref:protein phosphatase 1 regulatory subunit 36-like n=1 Tax=Stomoxys calcitrans TaxID=35570 RepID=UPI0027E39326|nr:protein phosphatase 1 regulatory subunit 36-like [Stomoxys calcitrans]
MEDCFVAKEPLAAIPSDEKHITIGGFQFLNTMDKVEEMIFSQEFQRSDTTYDADVILLQDIKNLVLFLAPTDIITKEFVHFVNTETVHSLLKVLIMYFEYFLKLMEFIVIRREETKAEKARMQTQQSTEIKRIFSANLSQYRLLLAREYSKILLGNGDMKKFYHLKPLVNISQTLKDQRFHEGFLAFCTLVVWVAQQRRDLEDIEMEINRLFRSEHFSLVRPDKYHLTDVEASLLYGKSYRRCNYRAQNSPLIQELRNIEQKNLPILWIGERKYRGNDLRILQIEYEFIVPSSQLCLIEGVTHGILGRPKILCDTLLNTNWEAVHDQYYTKYDPYRILMQPYLQLPKLEEMECQTYESYYQLVRCTELWDSKMLRKWIQRDEVIDYFKNEGMLTDIWMKCRKEVEDNTYGPSVGEIMTKFLARKEKLRKK